MGHEPRGFIAMKQNGVTMKQNGIFRNGMMKNVILHHGMMKNAIFHHGMMKNAILHHGVMKNGICLMVSDAKLCNNIHFIFNVEIIKKWDGNCITPLLVQNV